MRAPFVVAKDGSVDARLPTSAAETLAGIADDLARALEVPDDGMYRLYPVAFPDDPKQQEEFASMTHDELTQRKKNAARAVAETIADGQTKKDEWRATLDEEQAQQWLTFLNDARLVLGTRIDVKDDVELQPATGTDEDSRAQNTYLFLSSVQSFLIEALLERMPEGE